MHALLLFSAFAVTVHIPGSRLLTATESPGFAESVLVVPSPSETSVMSYEAASSFEQSMPFKAERAVLCDAGSTMLSEPCKEKLSLHEASNKLTNVKPMIN